MTPTRLVDSVPLKLGAFAVVLVLAFVVALGVGSAVGPVDEVDPVTTTAPDQEHGDPHGGEHGP